MQAVPYKHTWASDQTIGNVQRDIENELLGTLMPFTTFIRPPLYFPNIFLTVLHDSVRRLINRYIELPFRRPKKYGLERERKNNRK